MTWSYSGNPGASDLDHIRFLIQDTDTTDQLFSNEELTYLFNVADMVDVLEDDTIKELIRLRKGERQ